MAARHLLAIDQGTTSTRAILFALDGTPAFEARRELRQIYPAEGWVEHDGEEIWQAVLDVVREVLALAGIGARDVAAIGITNQRETTLVWERRSGRLLHHAIVWQDRRTADHCDRLRAAGAADLVAARTGLVVDPYFSGTKLAWVLAHVPEARHLAARGDLAFGTVDSFLLWRLTGGRVHATDATNAARTLLFDIHRQCWDADLLALLDIPAGLLPAVHDSAGDFGATEADLFGAPIPIRGIAGDQQAAGVGQACLAPGSVKATYGTGCFVLVNTGDAAIASRHRLLSTVALRHRGRASYALEGSIFVAGAAVQWLRDGLGLFKGAAETEALARAARPGSGVHVVPAFTGLGAPHWDPEARGAILGLTRDTGIAEIVRATLEAIAFQTRDLIEAIAADLAAEGRPPLESLRVDGGMVVNDWAMQFLADTLGLPVERPKVTETTALGAAFLAGLGAGIYDTTAAIADAWRLERRFEPQMGADERAARWDGWQKAVARVLSR
ncbi:glycerol kinase GlpK [Zavarzinia compransoris]|uniref:Glycerol kinase n=1 Tax=Zavarzinia compransoris TaxID=1264899 RepID=A0A317DZX7_9PROT|nr:glycerol kinase GlpK [Zavarzinia compransoris]PWR19724.1 glycerol kinase [Zavarzinia compransoris]TDP43328.1 glycerol kinase [Zavarzinia compransoris]